MKHICFPTDFSELSLKALPFAVAVAKNYDATLHLVNVLKHVSGMYPSEDREELLTTVKTKFEELKEDASKTIDPSKIKCEAIQADVLTGLEAYCKDNDIDLLLMTTHGHSGLKRLLWGSVAKNIIHLVECPVMVLNPEAAEHVNSGTLGPILAPVDIDHLSPEALTAAKDLAHNLKTPLEIVYALSDERGVVGIAGVYGEARIYRSYDTFIEEETAIAEKALGDLKENLDKKQDGVKVGYHVSGEPAHEAITNYCKKFPSSLVVMQTHVNSPLDRFFLGSTTERVIHSVNVPVVILNPKSLEKINGCDKSSTCC